MSLAESDMTPEGKVKSRIKRVLNAYNVYYFMPVQFGLGAAGVDFHCVMRWRKLAIAFFIEAKAPGEDLTERQELFLESRRESQSARTFVIDGDQGLRELIAWLEKFSDRRIISSDATGDGSVAVTATVRSSHVGKGHGR